MHVSETQPRTPQIFGLDEVEGLLIAHAVRALDPAERVKRRGAVPQVANGKLANDKVMYRCLSVGDEVMKQRLAGCEEIDPQRCINKDHRVATERLRGAAFRFGMVPPSAASLR